MQRREIIQRHTHGLLYSYSQIFFSRSLWFGALLLLASFINPVIGFSGLMAVLLTNILAESFSLSSLFISEGLYGFCSALIGMCMGAFFHISPVFFLILILLSALCLIITTVVNGFLGKYYLPFLGLPFLFSTWLLLLGTKYFTNLSLLSENSYQFLSDYLSSVNNFNDWQLPEIVTAYFRSLGAVFFQSNLLTGIIIAAGLFLYSRISFGLSIIGFVAAFYFYRIAGIDTKDLLRYFVGSNYIFIAIAIGGFFIVSNLWSYITVILIIPLVVLIHYGSTEILSEFHLPAFTFSFTITTILFLYLLKWRIDAKRLHLVQLQYSSPEKNLHHYLADKANYRYAKYFHLSLPFWGEWMVSQGHKGKFTHLGDWSKAFDFILVDEEKNSFRFPGNRLEDFYCYNKPVLSAGEGVVKIIEDNIDDNEISAVNTKQNWGNSIVVDHGNGLYSQLSHLKKEHFKVKAGDHIKRGDVLAFCGNSGRSPEPHIHFQLQLSQNVGSVTYDYPIASYIVRKENSFQLRTFDKPKEGELVRNPELNPLLKNAFHFVPGKKMKWKWKNKIENWDIYTDAWNRINIWCHETKSLARIENDGIIFRINYFEGNRNSFLYHFYLSCYKIFLGYYPELKLRETFPVLYNSNLALQWIEDFTSPFFHTIKSDYYLDYIFCDDYQYPTRIELRSKCASILAGYKLKEFTYHVMINKKGFEKINVYEGSKKSTATCEVQ